MNVITTPIEQVPTLISDRLMILLEAGPTTWFLSGGSNIDIEVAVIHKLVHDSADLSRLTILLNDERYGVVGHDDSNWAKLEQAGFMVDGPTYIPPFTEHETSLESAATRYEQLIQAQIDSPNYLYSQLGMGDDGHVSGILPHSDATQSTTLVCGYAHQPYQRLTTTFSALVEFDEIALVAYGTAKWPQLQNLEELIAPETQPAQIIKDIDPVSVYTDYKDS